MEAISHAGTAIGILASDGIVLAAEKKLSSKLLEPTKSSEKMYMIDKHIAVAVAGITADANILINQVHEHTHAAVSPPTLPAWLARMRRGPGARP